MTAEKEKQIIRLVEKQMPGVEIRVIETVKNNSQVKRGFCVREADSSRGIIVYQDVIADDCGESCTEEEAAAYICRKTAEERTVSFDHEAIKDWERAKHTVYKKVVNYDRNSCRLQELVHRRYLDLAEVYCLRIEIPGRGWGSMDIPVSLMEIWEVSEEELEEQAVSALYCDGYSVESLETVLEKTGCPVNETMDSGLHLILNRRKEFGAAVLTEPGLMKELMQKIGEDCYILPSSTHELLAIPCSRQDDPEELRMTVKAVNGTIVSPEEFLSDSIYCCHMDTGEVELCCGR